MSDRNNQNERKVTVMYNHQNTFCAWCSQWVFKGEGVFHNFRGGFTLCKECNVSRNKNMEQAKKKRKFRKNQLNLFTNQGGK